MLGYLVYCQLLKYSNYFTMLYINSYALQKKEVVITKKELFVFSGSINTHVINMRHFLKNTYSNTLKDCFSRSRSSLLLLLILQLKKIRIYTSIGGEFTRPREKCAAKFLLQTRKEVYELEFRMNTMLTNCFLVKLSALDNELSSFISKLNKRDPSIMT